MNIDQLIDQIKQQPLDRKVDVVDKVMAEVSQKPYLQSQRRKGFHLPVAAWAAAAAVAVLIAVVPFLRSNSYNEELIGSTIAQVNDSYNYPCYTSIEESAVDYLAPISYIDEE